MPYEIHIIVDDDVSHGFYRQLRELTANYGTNILYDLRRTVGYKVPMLELPAEKNDITKLNIRNLGLHSRTIGALSWAHRRGFAKSEIVTIGDLLAYSADDLLAMPQFGYVGLHNVRAALAKHGLHLMLEEVYEQGEG